MHSSLAPSMGAQEAQQCMNANPQINFKPTGENAESRQQKEILQCNYLAAVNEVMFLPLNNVI